MINRFGKVLAVTAVVASALGAVSSAGAEEKTHSFSMATSWGGGPLQEVCVKGFADTVKRLSAGRINIDVFPAGTLGPALKVSETVKNGVAQMGHLWVGYDWGTDPTAVLFGGYAGSTDTEKMLHWLYRDGGAELQAQWRKEKFDLISMPLCARTAEVFLHSRKPVKSLSDLKGLKLRTAGAWLEISKEMGAAPVTMPGGDVYPSLERGAIDATEWGTLWENKAPGFHRVTKYVIIPGVHQPTAPFEFVMNKDAWAEMSESDQELVRNAAFMTTMNYWLTLGQEDAKALAFYAEQGNEVIELDPEVQYAARESGLAWAEKKAEGNPWFRKVLDSQLAFDKLWSNASKYRNVKVRGQ